MRTSYHTWPRDSFKLDVRACARIRCEVSTASTLVDEVEGVTGADIAVAAAAAEAAAVVVWSARVGWREELLPVIYAATAGTPWLAAPAPVED
jgi:hypothetical protein